MPTYEAWAYGCTITDQLRNMTWSFLDEESAMTKVLRALEVDGVEQNISLRAVSDHYFPEGTNPASSEIYRHFRLLFDLIQTPGKSLFTTVDPFLEIINSQEHTSTFPIPKGMEEAKPESAEFHLLMQSVSGPKLNLFVELGLDDIKTSILSKLEEAHREGSPFVVNEIDPSLAGRDGKTRRIYRFPGFDDHISVKTLDLYRNSPVKKAPFIVYEENTDLFGREYITLQLAVDTYSDSAIVGYYSNLRPIISVEIREKNTPEVENIVMTWDDYGLGEVRFDQEDPYFHFSNDATGVRSLPMEVPWWKLKTMHDVCSGPYYYDNEWKSGKKEFARPYYFLELSLLAARLMHLSSISGVPIDGRTQKMIRDDIFRQIRETEQKFQGEASSSHPNLYSASEYMAFELLWRGVDAWKYFDQFRTTLMKTLYNFHNSPEQFWQSFKSFGLDAVIPQLRYMSDEEKSGYLRQLPELGLAAAAKAFSLLPGLDPYVDHRPTREFRQSDEYFMRILLAMAHYAYYQGKIAIAAFLVRDGRIISSAYNPEGQGGPHAEMMVISQAKELLGASYNKRDCIMYVTTGLCGGCGIGIRENAKGMVGHVIYGPPSTMTDRDILETIPAGNSILGPKPDIEVVSPDSLLGQQVLYSYQEIFGYHDLFPYKRYPKQSVSPFASR